MAYKVKARYYADPDCFGESFVVTSDNGDKDLRLDIGQKVKIVTLCMCGQEGYPRTDLGGTACVEHLCDECYARRIQERAM